MITMHVNLQIALAAASAAAAVFGVPMFVAEHAITANRQDGPYTSQAAVAAAGFTLAAAPTIYNWAGRIFAQRPRTSSVMIGRRGTGEHLVTALDAIEAVDPAAWYLTNIHTRTTADIMALAGWTSSRAKLAVAQSSSAAMLAGTASTAQQTNFQFQGTPADGDYSIAVTDAWTGALVGTATVTRTGGTPAANNDLATAMRTAWDAVPALAAISAAAGGSTNNVLIDFDGLGNLYTFEITDPETPDGLIVETDTPGTQNPGELTSDAEYNRTALIYHDDDTEYMDGSWCGRCLGFALDAPQGSGSWAYHVPAGITATRLTDAQKTQLMAYNTNFCSPVRYTSGTEEGGFTFPGRATSGRSLKIQTSLDVLQARLEEAFLGVFLRAAASNRPAVLFSDAGIAQLQTAAMGVFQRLTRAGHFLDGAVSENTGRITPYVDVPAASAVSSTDKSNGRLTGMTAEAVVAPEILSVGDATNVGFTIDLSM